MTNPSRISLTNLGADPTRPSGVRGDNYSPSANDARLTGPQVEQALVPRKLPPSQEDRNLMEEEWVANHPPPRHKRDEEIPPGVSHHQSMAHHPLHPPRMYPPTGQPHRSGRATRNLLIGGEPWKKLERPPTSRTRGAAGGMHPLFGRPCAGSRYGALPIFTTYTIGGNPRKFLICSQHTRGVVERYIYQLVGHLSSGTL